MNKLLDEKVRDVFGTLAMDKRRVDTSGLTKLGVPSYVSEWILEDIIPGVGTLTESEQTTLDQFVQQTLPRRNEQNVFRNRLLTGDVISILAHLIIEVRLSRTQQERFAKISVLGFNDCHISDALVEHNEDLLKQGVWGVIELMRTPDGVQVIGFEPMQATVDLKQFCEKRQAFDADEWRELMLRSCGYNPATYSVNQQIWILCRLLPLVQKNMHLMELAPKGTGKSFIYENISPRVYLTSGNITPAVLFYNNATDYPGLLARYDTIVIDEVQRIRLENPSEVISNLKIYLANGHIRRGGKADIASDCGLVILANITLNEDQQPNSEFVISDLPKFMHETAFLDRFRGIIPGWEIPKFTQTSKAQGLGLKADFFSDTLSAMRHDMRYDEWAREHIRLPEKISIRDEEAITSLASGLLKILYPDLKVSSNAFDNYCLQPAVKMRQIVRNQLWQLDDEYRQTNKNLVATVDNQTNS
jgi:ATP-dependent Lon protease